MPPESPIILLKYVGFVILAAIGGALGHITRTLDGGAKVYISRIILEASSAAFVGILALFFCKASHLNDLWTGIVVALAGWVGAGASLQLLENQIRQKFGLPEANDRNKKDSSND